MKSILKYAFKFLDRFFPPIKFKKKWFSKELEPTEEDLDKWAEEYERKFNESRRKKRG